MKLTGEAHCIDNRYSTTRRLFKAASNYKFRSELSKLNNDDNLAKNVSLLGNESCQGEGGLRTKGYFKKSLPDRPLITIITVVFNGEDHIEETILSIINQTYDNVEYIIVDGASTDKTIQTLKKYDGAIDYWVSQKDHGIYNAMNKASTLALGQWLMFINAGDKMVYLDEQSLFGPYVTKSCHVFLEERRRLERHPLTKFYLTRNTPCHQSIQYLKSEFALFDTGYGLDADYEQLTRIAKRTLQPPYSESIVYFAKPGASAEIKKYPLCFNYNRRCITVRKNIGIAFAVLSLMHFFRRLLIHFASKVLR